MVRHRLCQHKGGTSLSAISYNCYYRPSYNYYYSFSYNYNYCPNYNNYGRFPL